MEYEHGLELSVGRRNLVTLEIGAGPWVKASRIVVRITLLRSSACHKLSVRPNKVVGFCDFGTLHHSREFWVQIDARQIKFIIKPWLFEFWKSEIRQGPEYHFSSIYQVTPLRHLLCLWLIWCLMSYILYILCTFLSCLVVWCWLVILLHWLAGPPRLKADFQLDQIFEFWISNIWNSIIKRKDNITKYK